MSRPSNGALLRSLLSDDLRRLPSPGKETANAHVGRFQRGGYSARSGAPPASEPDIHRQAVAVAGARGAEPRRLALGDQLGGAADGDGIEDVVALGTGKAFDRAGEAMHGQQAA